MNLIQTLIRTYEYSPIRKYLRPIERVLRSKVASRSRITVGPLRGYIYRGEGEGVLIGTYELDVQRAIQEHVKLGDVVYDVGANHGYMSLLSSVLTGPEGHVFAFEPLPYNIDVLKQTIQENHIPNITLIPLALSDSAGNVSLYLGDGRHARPSLYPWHGDDHITVATITLDSFVAENVPPNVVKMDIEGAEHLVLRGAGNLLRRTDAPIWIIEVHSKENDEECSSRLVENGYTIEKLIDSSNPRSQHHIIARKKN